MSGGAGRRRLVLHVDLNNTVVAADAVSGQGPRAALNTFLSTVTWGRAGAAGEWQWASDRPSLRPPCPDSFSYYSRHGRDPAFTEAGPGRCFGGLHAHHLQLLEWPGRQHDVFSVQGEPSKRYHLILPAFFRLLDTLHREGRAFAVVFRTFGTDLPRALRAVSCALAGQHPQFPALRDVALPVDLTPGQIRCSKREVVLTRGAERLATREDGRKLYDYFSSFEGIGGFQDHFDWWARNQFSSRGGKPLWIDPHDPGVHHIFIDDNIRLDDADTIVHPQPRAVSLIKELALLPSVASTAGHSGYMACLRAAVQPAPGFPHTGSDSSAVSLVSVTEQHWDGNRLPGGLQQSHGKDQKVKSLFPPVRQAVAAKGRAVGRGLPGVGCSAEPFSSSCVVWPVP
ncbi:uncharacterized protein LOC129211545 isoform X1 [Grus americana]|uniref:uncharacterized protein LOC129211545 isoform X1 n=1 Tax=Grus americana TaxID=9117 RepID=UPI0024086131|nr:uncharacterized protein LOC129211545 isoform X1 [Grus americana]